MLRRARAIACRRMPDTFTLERSRRKRSRGSRSTLTYTGRSPVSSKPTMSVPSKVRPCTVAVVAPPRRATTRTLSNSTWSVARSSLSTKQGETRIESRSDRCDGSFTSAMRTRNFPESCPAKMSLSVSVQRADQPTAWARGDASSSVRGSSAPSRSPLSTSECSASSASNCTTPPPSPPPSRSSVCAPATSAAQSTQTRTLFRYPRSGNGTRAREQPAQKMSAHRRQWCRRRKRVKDRAHAVQADASLSGCQGGRTKLQSTSPSLRSSLPLLLLRRSASPPSSGPPSPSLASSSSAPPSPSPVGLLPCSTNDRMALPSERPPSPSSPLPCTACRSTARTASRTSGRW
mmetsp:Transcript_2901/g.9477  ORF Transcript_2901/g.9477 Transcript_2901/m.9477 type:complete len:347 (+) Transcript_2901:388-1428(+)